MGSWNEICEARSVFSHLGEKDKPKPISTDPREMTHYAEAQRLGHGKIEFDELGNAIWVPAAAGAGDDVMRRLLDDPNLAFSNEYTEGTVKRIQPNPRGIKQGYDPYESGQLVRKEWKKKKDLRRLSEWIKKNRPKDD